MSLGACLPGLEQEGKITAEQAAEARALYEERLAAHARHGTRETAEALASREVLDALERNVTRKEYLAGLAIQRRNGILNDIAGYGDTTGDPRFRDAKPGARNMNLIDGRAISALIDQDPRARYSNVEARRKAILFDASRQLDKALTDHSANLLGQVRNKAELDQMGRELFDADSGNPIARGNAEAWRRVSETLRQRFNKAGGDIGFRADWGVPMKWDAAKVRAVGEEQFLLDVLDELAPERMIDQKTGLPLTRDKLVEIMPELFGTIRSDGANKLVPGQVGSRSLANSRGDARFMVFKDYDSWSRINAKYGSGTLYDAMMGHMESMARDIAALEIFGPNPEATLRFLIDTMKQRAQLDPAPNSKAPANAKMWEDRIDRLWSEYTGKALAPKVEWLGKVGSTYRALATARHLGSASLSAVSDAAFVSSRLKFNGLSRRSALGEYLKLMAPGSVETQRMAIRRGVIAEDYISRTAAQNRYVMEEMSAEFARRTASAVLRLSLLSRHTQMARMAYQIENLAAYSDAAGQTFGQLDPFLRGQLLRYGIDAAGWEKLRKAPMDTDRGAEWISPHNLKGADREIGDRFLEMVNTEVDAAVPMADLKTRATMNVAAPRGTLQGELIRSGPLMFRSFGISVFLRQIGEIRAMSPATAAGYAASLFIGMTLMGAVAMQLKQLAQGKDPRPMPDGDFWLAAMQQGGGFGIFGDLLFSLESRGGYSLGGTAAGVLPQDVGKLWDTAVKPQDNLVKTTKGFMPGNNLWYTRTAFDRMVADQIDELVNPDFRKDQQRLIRQQRRDYGADYFWQPGDTAPDRAPDFANALEEGPDE